MKRAFYVSTFALSLLVVTSFVPLPAAASDDCYYPVTAMNFVGRITSGVNVRDKTCMDSSVIGRVAGGVNVQVLGEADGWYKIKTPDGVTGFVWGDFITKSDAKYIEEKTSVKVEEKTKVEVKKEDTTLQTRLKGRILLQVEKNGEAWYVHPEDGRRYYMKDGDTAYEMMRQFGLGISNADLAKLKAGNKDLVNRLKGKIVLQVESHGEAYYIHPDKGTLHYLQNGKEAYRVMRELSLGITDKDLSQIKQRNFEDFVREKKEGKSNDYSAAGSIFLSGSLSSGVANLNWTVKGFEPKDGFKVVYSTSTFASYPGDPAEFVDGSKRVHVLTSLNADTTYYVRVCAYIGSGCGTYSNEVMLKTPTANGKIVLSGYVKNGKVYLDWSASDIKAENGYKVVWSAEVNPSYPGNEYHHLGSSKARNDILSGLAAGTYHFRVCEYTNNGCAKYSNDIEIVVPSNTFADNSNNPADSGVVPSGVDLDTLNDYWLKEVNQLRAAKGLRQLVIDDRWVETATEWAEYMAEKGVATHDRADGKTMHQWIDAKDLPFTTRNSVGGWSSNYFTENIAWGYATASTESVEKVLDDTMAFYLSEASSNGPHYRTIYHPDWNTVGVGFAFVPDGKGYKVYVAMHYGSLVR